MTDFQKMIGKTIQSVDDGCVNSLSIGFTDGTWILVYADCGTDYNSIPFFEAEFKEQ